jgi:hypothetical protein
MPKFIKKAINGENWNMPLLSSSLKIRESANYTPPFDFS